MSTDAPSAGLGQPEDVWDGERMAALESRILDAGAQQLLTAATRHLPTGRLVGYTRIRVPESTRSAALQWETLVLREHRGHRLGTLLKVANLEQVRAVAPRHPSVITSNAEENRHMLSVNEAVGYVPIGYEGGWAKALSP